MKRKILILLVVAGSFTSGITRITMYLDSNVEFDLGAVIYPPYVFPGYYFPTRASLFNPQGIVLMVGHQRIGNQHSIANIYLATRGSRNFSPTVGLDQLYFAPDGEPLPPAGVDPPAGAWRPYSIVFQPIETFPVQGAGLRWFLRLQDLVFQADDDDAPASSTITVYYRLYGL